MPRMRVLLPHVFAQKPVEVGDEYEATETEASLLLHLGWAGRADSGNAAAVNIIPSRRRNGRRVYNNRSLTS